MAFMFLLTQPGWEVADSFSPSSSSARAVFIERGFVGEVGEKKLNPRRIVKRMMVSSSFFLRKFISCVGSLLVLLAECCDP